MISNIIVSLVSAFIGTFFGAFLLARIQNMKTVKTRKIAKRALDIIGKYASHDGVYSTAEADFNASLNVVEKRAILVCLYKLGIPVAEPVVEPFNLKRVHFRNERIDKEEIKQMKAQIDKGNCDKFFYMDVESVFSANSRIQAVRSIAKKYVDVDLLKCTYDKELERVYHPVDLTKYFSTGEIYNIQVFREVTASKLYFDENGNVVEEQLEALKKEIDLDLWDMYLFWDYSSYMNLQAQRQMAELFNNYMPAIIQQTASMQKGVSDAGISIHQAED